MQTRRKEQVRKQKDPSPITNTRIKIMTFNFFEEEWSGNCGACYKDFYAPTKSEYLMQYARHAKSKNCLGGY